MERTEKKILSNGNESRNFGLLSCNIKKVCISLAIMEMQISVTPVHTNWSLWKKKDTSGHDEEIGALLRSWWEWKVV